MNTIITVEEKVRTALSAAEHEPHFDVEYVVAELVKDEQDRAFEAALKVVLNYATLKLVGDDPDLDQMAASAKRLLGGREHGSRE